MTRLTKGIREQILANAQTKSGNRARREATLKKRKDWDEDVRIDSLKEHAALLERLDVEVEKIRAQVPEAFQGGGSPIMRRGQIRVNCAGMTVYANGWEGEKVAPGGHTITADNPLAQRFHDICAEEKANTESWERVKVSVNAATNAVTTVKALLKAWPEAKELLPEAKELLPEAKELLPENMEEAKIQLPAIQVADLNALVGLPSGDD